MKFAKHAKRAKSHATDIWNLSIKEMKDNIQASKDKSMAREAEIAEREQAQTRILLEGIQKSCDERAKEEARVLFEKAYAKSYGFENYQEYWHKNEPRPYEFQNVVLRDYAEKAEKGGVKEKRALKRHLKRRKRWEDDPNAGSPIWLKLLGVFGVISVIGILSSMLILALAFPVFGMFLCIGGAFGTMGGDGAMPEKEL